MSPSKTAPDEALPLENTGVSVARKAAHASGWSCLFVIPMFFVTLFTGAVIGMYFQPPGLKAFFDVTGLQPGAGSDTPIAVAVQQVTSQQHVAVLSEGDVVALGRIIPKGDVVSVAPPSGAGDARVAALAVEEGDAVSEGDEIARLDNLPQLQSAVSSARATVEVKRAALDQTRANIDANRAEAAASLRKAEASVTETQTNLERVTSLFERGVSTRAQLDSAIASANTATREVERASAVLSRYAEGSDMAKADIVVAEANLVAARADLERAELDVEHGYVRAPMDGTVLRIHARPGERPGTAGIADLGDTSQMTIEVEVYQSMIARVALGDPVTATADALSKPLTGAVSSIGLEIDRQSIISNDPAANTDARVVEVTVSLDADATARASHLTNLETVVRIDAGRTP